jgi:flagellar motor switch protein FliM
MSDILSQDAIDQLLPKISSGEAAAGEVGVPPDKRKITVYDFKRPDKFSKDQIRTVSVMHETFARLATTTLSAQLRSLAHAHVASVDQLTFEEFIRSIPNPTTLAIIQMDPLKGSAVLEIDPSISFAIVERLFGGQGDAVKLTRQLTDIEASVMEGIIVRMLGNLRDSWATVLDLRPRLSQIEVNPQFAQVVPPNEMVVLVTLEAKVGESEGMLNLALPYLTIEPIIWKLSTRYWYSRARKPDKLPAVTTAGLDISAEVILEGERLSMRDLGALKKGSLVRIPGYARGQAFLRMGGCPLLRMEARRERQGRPPVYTVTGGIPKESRPFLKPTAKNTESSGMEAGIREALRELGAGIDASLADMKNTIAELRKKQGEMVDQLSFGPQDQEMTDLKKSAEHPRPFDFIRRADPAHLVNFIQQEHPQTIALILSYLEPQKASLILGSIPHEIQSDVAKRIATMDRTSPEVLREVERVLEKKLSMLSSEDYTPAGGVESIVEILNFSSRSLEKHVVESLEKKDPELAEEIKKRMFVFDDIVLLDRKAAESVVKRIDVEDLLRAMKAAPDEVRDLIWGCMPPGDIEKLKLRFEELGRVRLNEVDAAQQRIVSVIREMEEAGEIVVARPGEMIG